MTSDRDGRGRLPAVKRLSFGPGPVENGLMAQLFGRYEAAALLAVEKANGGELAGLEQVIISFEGLFGASVAPTTFVEAMELLIDAHLVEWRDYCLGLSVEGRRLIRRSGSHWSADFPAKVADQLSELSEDDLAGEGELACPSEADILEAMRSLGRGALQASQPAPGGELAPSGLAHRNTIGARLLEGLPAGIGLNIELPYMPPQVPPGQPGEGGDEDGTEAG